MCVFRRSGPRAQAGATWTPAAATSRAGRCRADAPEGTESTARATRVMGRDGESLTWAFPGRDRRRVSAQPDLPALRSRRAAARPLVRRLGLPGARRRRAPAPGDGRLRASAAPARPRSQVPVWLPWPLPLGWLVSGLQHAGDEHTGPVATVLAVLRARTRCTVDVDDLSARPAARRRAARRRARRPPGRPARRSTPAAGSAPARRGPASSSRPATTPRSGPWTSTAPRPSSARPPASGSGRSPGPARRPRCCSSSSSCATPATPTTSSSCRTARCRRAWQADPPT